MDQEEIHFVHTTYNFFVGILVTQKLEQLQASRELGKFIEMLTADAVGQVGSVKSFMFRSNIE